MIPALPKANKKIRYSDNWKVCLRIYTCFQHSNFPLTLYRKVDTMDADDERFLLLQLHFNKISKDMSYYVTMNKMVLLEKNWWEWFTEGNHLDDDFELPEEG